MKQEFTSLYGRVSVEDGTIVLKNFYLRAGDNLISKLIFTIVPWVVFLSILFSGFDDAGSKTRLIIWGFLSALSLIYAYELLFLDSYSNKVSITNVQACEAEKDRVGYITTVILKLRSGRRRIIRFRSFEGQHEAFLNLISQHISQSQFAD